MVLRGSFVGYEAKGPSRAQLPVGSALTITLDAATFDVIGWGIGGAAPDLAGPGQPTSISAGELSAALDRPKPPAWVPGLTVVPSDPAAAAGVPITGATPLEATTAREVLADLGAAPGIASVSFAGGIVSVEPVTGDPRSTWLVSVFSDTLVALLRQAGETTLPWATNQTGRLDASRSGGADAARSAAQQVIDRARVAGLRVSVTAYAIGAIAVVFHLDERGYLAPERTDWNSIVHASGPRLVPRLLLVQDPYGGTAFYVGDGVCYECNSGVVGAWPNRPLPADLDGPTRLTVKLTPSSPPLSAARVDLDCTSASIPTPRTAACRAIILDRFGLFPPQPSDIFCGGVEGRASFSGSGTLGGLEVATGSGCGGPTDRWLKILRAADLLPADWRAAYP